MLFGDVTEVFTHDGEGHEAHVDRTLLISCTSEHGERVDVASCDGIICVSLPARSFMQTVSVPRALVNPDGTRVSSV